jgi:rhamnogalacturonyl hydrolase YesR
MPMGLLMLEEVPGLFFVIYLSLCKEREIKQYLQKQETKKEAELKDQESGNCEHAFDNSMCHSHIDSSQEFITAKNLMDQSVLSDDQPHYGATY